MPNRPEFENYSQHKGFQTLHGSMQFEIQFHNKKNIFGGVPVLFLATLAKKPASVLVFSSPFLIVQEEKKQAKNYIIRENGI